LGKIDQIICAAGTTEQDRVVLLCLREMYVMIQDHLASHNRWSAPARQVLTSVLTTVAVAIAMLWIFQKQP
jgi:hypothetical protein